MIPNLKAELADFRRRVEVKRADVEVTYREGYKGSGAAGPGLMLALLVVFAGAEWRRTS